MRIIVSGNRDFDEPLLLTRKLDSLTRKLNKKKLRILNRGILTQESKNDGPNDCISVDAHVEKWCGKNLVCFERHHLDCYPRKDGKPGDDWHKKRDKRMIRSADAAVIFWDGKDKETQCFLQKVEQLLKDKRRRSKKSLQIVQYKEGSDKRWQEKESKKRPVITVVLKKRRKLLKHTPRRRKLRVVR